VRFLGETARREERRRRIEEAQARLAGLREVLAALGEEIAGVQGRERVLAREWRTAHDLPQLQAVHDRLLAVRREEQERERRRKAADAAAETVEADTREVQQKTTALDRATDAAPYLKDRPKAEVEGVDAALRELAALARSVGDDVERMEEIRRAHAARERSLEALRIQIEELAPRIAGADERARMLDAQLGALAEQLSAANVGREELAAAIAELDRRLTEIGQADAAAATALTRAETNIETYTEQEPEVAGLLRDAALRLRGAEAEFRARLDAYPTLDEYGSAARDTGLDRAMQLILHDVAPDSTEAEAKRARDELQRAFLQASGVFEEMSPSLDGDIIRFAHELGSMRLYELHRVLEEQTARNENLLEESDRILIEQLMLRDVVDAIRDAIRNTRRWVEEINGTLGRMQLFKGGIMRLHWEPRPRESTDAFDPRRLDDLLSQRGIALDETRRSELLDIFRNMVGDIRRKNRDRELLEDYATALRKCSAATTRGGGCRSRSACTAREAAGGAPSTSFSR
jgi:hypothetical protein